MILVVKSGKKEIDRVTVTRDTITYATQAARSTVESRIDMLGRRVALDELRSWSNGYITFSEIVG